MHAHQDLGRLLLLRVRPPGVQAAARLQLRQHGPGHDRGNQVGRLGKVFAIWMCSIIVCMVLTDPVTMDDRIQLLPQWMTGYNCSSCNVDQTVVLPIVAGSVSSH